MGLVVIHLCIITKEWKKYEDEMKRWFIPPDRVLFGRVEDIGLLAECTTYENHLARVLVKPKAQWKVGVDKYSARYTHVPPNKVMKCFQAEVDKLKK